MHETLAIGKRTARKEHQCFDCYRPIEKGTEYGFGTFKYDDQVYTLKYHLDCKEAAWEYFDQFSPWDFDEGYPPLLDDINNGDGQPSIDWLRGRWPHVACRLEFHDQKRAACAK